MTPSRLGERIVRLGSVGSTMAEVDALAASGAAEGTVVVADEQTAGRGRGDRRWLAPAGTALLCSILLRPPVAADRLSVLPLLVGVAVAEAIEAVAPVACALKWPNDVWIDGRKVAGILLTARSGQERVEHATVGIGVNVNVPASDLVAGATSLLAESGRAHDRDRLLVALIPRLEAQYRSFLAFGGRPNLTAWQERAALFGEDVAIEMDGVMHEGTFAGINDDGRLLLRTAAAGTFTIYAGELVRGPIKRHAQSLP